MSLGRKKKSFVIEEERGDQANGSLYPWFILWLNSPAAALHLLPESRLGIPDA
jgi:hypothetical protein